MQTFLLMAFESTHDAIKAETGAKRAGLAARLIPVPPEVSAGCGLSLRGEVTDEAALREILEQEEVEAEFFLLKRDGINRSVERL